MRKPTEDLTTEGLVASEIIDFQVMGILIYVIRRSCRRQAPPTLCLIDLEMIEEMQMNQRSRMLSMYVLRKFEV